MAMDFDGKKQKAVVLLIFTDAFRGCCRKEAVPRHQLDL